MITEMYLPSSQSLATTQSGRSHDVFRAFRTLSRGHGMHEVCLFSAAKSPVGQCLQGSPWPTTAEYFPASHALQSREPGASAYLPAWHVLHFAPPGLLEYHPIGHDAHGLAFDTPKVPLSHRSQATLPLRPRVEYPSGHGPHSVAPEIWEYRFSVHVLQLAAAMRCWYNPGKHLMQLGWPSRS